MDPPRRFLHVKAQQMLLWYPRQTIKRVICFIFEMLHFMFDIFVRLYVDLSSVFDEWFASTIGQLPSLLT